MEERRNLDDWNYNNVPAPQITDRGFTGHACPPELNQGHEHLDMLGLINMNGRMYDPVLGRFLSVDPVVQSPDFSQSYNGYSYCWNNPLRYIDPKGTTVYVISRDNYQSVINAVVSGVSITDIINKYSNGLRFSDAGWIDIYANENGEPGSNGGYLFSNENAGYTYLWLLSGKGMKVETMAWVTNLGLFVLPIEGYTYDKSRKLKNQHDNAEWEYYDYANFKNEWYMFDPNASRTYRLIANIHIHSWNKEVNAEKPDQGFSLFYGINDDSDFLSYFNGIPMSVVDYDGTIHSMIYDSSKDIPFRVIQELDRKFDIFNFMQQGGKITPIYLKYLIQK